MWTPFSTDICLGVLLRGCSKASRVPGGSHGVDEGNETVHYLQISGMASLNGKRAANKSLAKVIDKEQAFNFAYVDKLL